MRRIFTYLAVFAAALALIFFEGRHMIFLQEQTQLFQNDWHYIFSNAVRVCGLAEIMNEFIVQFAYLPWLGAALLALLSLGAYCFTSSCLKSVSGDERYADIAAAAPLIPLLYSMIVCENTCPLTAYTLTMAATAGFLRVRGRCSWAAAAAGTIVLFFACGSPALLLPLVYMVYVLTHKDIRGFYAFVPLAAYAVAGFLCVRLEMTGSWKDLVMYRIPLYESNASFPYSLPALSAMAVTILAAGASAFAGKIRAGWIAAAVAVAVNVVSAVSIVALPDKEYAGNLGNKTYSTWAELHYLYVKGDYAKLLGKYKETAPVTSVESNYINLALYRTGRLTSDFLRYNPRWKHNSLRAEWLDMQFPFPFIWVETCNEMGALSKAQQSAFEGNILAGPRGASPMVMYLAESEIIRGNYKSASRYISCLENTVFYRKKAARMREMLSDDAVAEDSYYSSKRACYYEESRLLYDMNDLWLMKEVARNNTGHNSTFEYAGTMILAAGELNTFVDFIMDMSKSRVCEPPFPPLFKQALAMAYANNQVALNVFGVEPDIVQDYKEFSLAVSGKLKNKSKAEMTIAGDRGKYWYYLYNMLRASEPRK